MNHVFSDDGWSIINYGGLRLAYSYYSRHNTCKGATIKGWMDWDHRTCDDCSSPVPESIQTLITLLCLDKV